MCKNIYLVDLNVFEIKEFMLKLLKKILITKKL